MAALTALAVYLLARLGFGLILPDHPLFWSPAGLLLALLALTERRDWPWLLAGAFAGGLAGDIRTGNSIAFCAAGVFLNCTQSLLGAWLLTWLLGSPVRLSSLRSLIVLVVGVAIACNALVSVFGAVLLDHASPSQFGGAFLLWGAINAVRILLVMPLVLTGVEAFRNRKQWKPGRVAEAALVMAVLAASGQILLSGSDGIWLAHAHAYLTFPLLLWAALRFGPAGASAGTFLLGMILSWNTAHDHGVFTLPGESPAEQALQIFLYVAFASLSSLVPAVLFEEQQTTRRELQESQRLYKAVTDTAPDAIISFDQDSKIVFANPGVLGTFGYTPSELVGQSMNMVLPESSRAHHDETVRETIRRFEETGIDPGIWSLVARKGLHKNGQIIPLEASFGALFGDGRHIFTSIVRDVSERELVEQSLHESRERYHLLFESNPHPMWVCDRQTLRFLEVNEVAIAQYGYSRDEFLAMCTNDILPPEDVQNSPDGAMRHRRKNGTVMDVEVFDHVVKLDGREVSLVAAQDVTDARRIAAQMDALRRYDAIGKLAGGIAHDFNNLVAVIMGWAEISLDKVEPESPVHKALEQIMEQATRASRLTQQLLAFASKQILERRLLSLNEVVTESLDLLRKVVGEHVEVQAILLPALNSVRADQSQIEQVLLNLAVNARDAMPRGGRLILETENIFLDEEFCRIHIWAQPGQYARLSVSDEGVGMDAATLEHIFDPFFTTKKVGKGTGLGLATVYGILQQHKGFIHAYSEPGCGATFRIYLPAGVGEAKAVERSQELSIVGGRETILLVDDHDALRAVSRMTLLEYGYTVFEACNGAEALQLFRDNPDRIDMVVSDVVMPRMSGPDSVREIRAERPNLPILFITGYSAELQLISEANGVGLPVLQKPYRPKMLAAKVREILDEALSLNAP